MNSRIYAMEMSYMNRLLSDRKELLDVIKGMNAAEMRNARKDLIEQCAAVNVTPITADEINKSYTVDDEGTAHISIVGQLTPKAETDACGAYTADALTEYGHIVAASQAADADERVNHVEYFIDSPGGYVSGLMPAVKAMREVSKPTSALVGGMAASAAYWLATQTDTIVAESDLSRFGSIGVAVEEFDNTKMLENAGITKRVYTSTEAPRKRPDTSTEDGQNEIIMGLDDLHVVFAQNVADGRHVDINKVNETFGKGAVFTAAESLRRGMIDEVIGMPKRESMKSVDVVDSPVNDRDIAASAETEQEVKNMNLDDLKKENSAVYNEAVAVGMSDGITSERKRRNDISDIMKADPENANLKTVCEEAIQEGIAADGLGFTTKVQVAIRDGEKMDGDNAETVETQSDNSILSAEDKEAAKLAGMTIEEYKATLEVN